MYYILELLMAEAVKKDQLFRCSAIMAISTENEKKLLKKHSIKFISRIHEKKERGVVRK